jgi:hypothetical protein
MRRSVLVTSALLAAVLLSGCSQEVPDDEGFLVPDSSASASGIAQLPPPAPPSVADPAPPEPSVSQDPYVEGGAGTGPKDKYLTDPIPEGKPKPVEPEEATVDPAKRGTATLSVSAAAILDHMDQFNQDKASVLPAGGVVMARREVGFTAGESVFDVLKREAKAAGLHMEFAWTPVYNSAYVEGINNLYEFDCGPLSGWMYKVNGWFPNYGASRYQVAQGDVIEWVYTCDLGRDIGGWYPGLVQP